MTPRLVLLRVGDQQFALPMEAVRHILLTPRIIPLVLIRPGFKGVFLHQDEILPLLDLPRLLAGAVSGPENPYVVVCDTDYGPLGIFVDQVLQIVERGAGALRSGDLVPDQKPAENSFVYNGNTYPLLDIEALLNTLPR